jgi:membrane protease YdiL (CAAX protease family)
MQLSELVYRYRFIVFVTITLGLAALVFASGMDPQMAPFALVLLPTLAALVTAGVGGHGEMGRLFRRLGRWRASPLVYAAVIGIPVLGNLLIVVAAVATGTPLSNVFSEMTATALIVPLVVLLPAFFEEFGWRGFGIPALGRRPLIVSAVLVGIPFTLIHLPLHLPGHLNDGLPMWPTVVSVMSLAILFAWTFAAGKGSVILPGLMHAAANGAVPLTWGVDADTVWVLRAVVFAALAVVVVILARQTFFRPLGDDGHETEMALAPSPAG